MRREGSQMGEGSSRGGKRVGDEWIWDGQWIAEHVAGSTGNEGRNVMVMTVAPIRVLCKAEAVAHCFTVFRGMLGGVSRSSVEWRLILGARQQ